MQEIEVSLIITDYFMPEMTGYDLLRKIKVIWFFPDLGYVSYDLNVQLLIGHTKI